ncbi:hypothetical protein [Rubritalea tangerina]|uniref:hypothetical protein n=1 Tax=Rubritalea tangerina TaxID=430798 RepID=UPI00360E36CC
MGFSLVKFALRDFRVNRIILQNVIDVIQLSARTGGLHWALIFCKLIPTIRPFRFAQWYYGRWHWEEGGDKKWPLSGGLRGRVYKLA